MEDPRPLAGIALSLSGGGYRAAAFHLGLLRTLSAVGLLEDVRILSTVSGGTFIGAAYALARSRGEPFAQFSTWFEERLRTQRPAHRAIEILVSGRCERLPRRTLIAAQAEAVDEQFLDGARFGALFEGESHLEEITFNATDFRLGLPFRFQRSYNPRAKIGHGKCSIPLECAKEIRLADIVAASSCFPGGFEPLGFPHDFDWGKRGDLRSRLTDAPDSHFASPVPLMDGGVADNQGVGSLLTMLERRKSDDTPIELLLISDADQAPDRPLLEHHLHPVPRGPKLGTALLLARVLAWVGAIAATLLAVRLIGMLVTRQLGSWFSFVETVFSLLVVSATVGALVWTGRTLRRQVWDRIPRDAGIDIEGTIRQLTVSWLGDLLWMRLESLFALTNSVFMKSIRDLRYQKLFQDREYRGKVIANQIYSVVSGRGANKHPAWEPTEEMRRVCERARNMPTTLWLDDPTLLDDAIRCGEITTCRNLAIFLADKEEGLTDSQRQLAVRLQAQWRALGGAPT